MVLLSDASPEQGDASRRARCASGGAGSSTATAACLHDERVGSGVATTAVAGSPAGSSSAAGTERRCCSRASSRALLPRRGDGVRGRPPAVRALPARGLRAFGEIWQELHPGQVGADAIDAQLHHERMAAARPDAEVRDLPDGAFVLLAGEPWLVRGTALRRWTPAGYAEARPRSDVAQAPLVTPGH